MPQFFRVTSRIRHFLGHADSDVEVLWFVVGRSEPIGPYDKLIADYIAGETWSEKAADELFSADEAQAFKAYLLARHSMGQPGAGSPITVTLTEMALPLSKDALLSPRDVEVEGSWEFYKLSEDAEDFPLDIAVWGYYDASLLQQG